MTGNKAATASSLAIIGASYGSVAGPYGRFLGWAIGIAVGLSISSNDDLQQ